MHGIDRADVTFIMALEFMILLGYNGRLKSDSAIEKELFTAAIEQLKKIQMTKVENALVWLYIKTWGVRGQHVLDQNLWNFGKADFDAALMAVLYSQKQESERIKLLRGLILEKDESTSDCPCQFYEWSKDLYSEVSSELLFKVTV